MINFIINSCDYFRINCWVYKMLKKKCVKCSTQFSRAQSDVFFCPTSSLKPKDHYQQRRWQWQQQQQCVCFLGVFLFSQFCYCQSGPEFANGTSAWLAEILVTAATTSQVIKTIRELHKPLTTELHHNWCHWIPCCQTGLGSCVHWLRSPVQLPSAKG